MSLNLSVVNSGAFTKHKFNSFLRHILSGLSKIVCLWEKYFFGFPSNRWTSPYIIAIAKC